MGLGGSPCNLSVCGPTRNSQDFFAVWKAPLIARVVNPLAAPLTTRHGMEVVMFPTGRGSSPGSSGKSHSVSDFETLVAAGKKAARSVARLKAGVMTPGVR